ncbi:MAG: radical SAM family heme chaperone HemW [Lachnospiraceae bacterium]|nr:radical SAM family heme chaperone HemW [Lachnospiraceae bacterium]
MKKELGIYVHIPFCVRKCDYCDFLSFPAGEEAKERYVQALIDEIKSVKAQMQDYEVPTIFLGGGTPSILRANQIRRIMDALAENFTVHKEAEISMEMNPGTYSPREMQELMQGIGLHPNRISIGLQSASNEELKGLGRIHTYEDFLETYRGLRAAGITNINVDLMSAIPGQTLKGWETTLEKIAALGPEHISAYSLIVEEGTPFAEKQLDLPDEDTERLIYERTGEILEQNDYQRYEISNYARPGYACRHNISYWKRENYLGLGLGSASLVENVRWNNTKDMEMYLANTKEPQSLRQDIEVLTDQEQMEEFMFLGLRMMEGIGVKAFQETFGDEIEDVYGEILEELYREGLLVKTNDRIALTGRGIDISNYVMAKFLF